MNTSKKRGPPAERLKIKLGWEEAVRKAIQKTPTKTAAKPKKQKG